MNVKTLHDAFLKCGSKVDIDSRFIKKDSIFFAIKGENFDGNNFAIEALKNGSQKAVIDSNDLKFKGIKNIIRVKDSLKTLQNLASYHRKKNKSKVIALTGSNGKTTSKELINSVLGKKYKTISTSGNYNNHIGVPLSLLEIKDDTEFSIIELGANNFGEINFLTKMVQPDYGYITNFGKAHLEGFINLDGVIKAKTELYNWIIENNKTLILNLDDNNQKKFQSYSNFSFGSKKSSNFVFERLVGENINVKESENIYKSNMYGDYNYSNICSAIAIGLKFDVDFKLIQNAISSYIPKNNRSQIIDKYEKHIILDAYNANPTSVEFAMESFSKLIGSKAIIIGDMLELGDSSLQEHKLIVEFSNNLNIDKCYFIGNDFYKVKTNNKKVFFFKAKDDFYNNISKISEKNILIKGSRGMKMEEIIQKKIK